MILIIERCQNEQCRIEKHDRLSIYCDVCQAMLDAVSTEFFGAAHKEWVDENQARIAIKRRLMGHDRLPEMEGQ